MAGYQGVSARKEVTTLGRGGSDTTAVALAAALGADCEIYSDVDGVFTADPRVVPDARRLDELSYEEMQELAQAGAKVLNAQAVEFAREKGIAIHARSTFGAAGGDGGPRRQPPGADRRAWRCRRSWPCSPSRRRGSAPVLAELDGAGAVAPRSWPGPAARRAWRSRSRTSTAGRCCRGGCCAAVPELAIADEGLGAVSVVGTGLSAPATGRCARWWPRSRGWRRPPARPLHLGAAGDRLLRRRRAAGGGARGCTRGCWGEARKRCGAPALRRSPAGTGPADGGCR